MTLIYALIPYTLSKCEIIYTYKFIIYLHVCQPHFCQKKFKKYIIFKEKNIKFFFLISTFLSEISETFKKLLEISRLGNE